MSHLAGGLSLSVLREISPQWGWMCRKTMFSFDGGFKASACFPDWGLPWLGKAVRIYELAETRRTAHGTRGRQNVLSLRQGLMHQAFWKCFPSLRIEGRWRQVALVHLHHLLSFSNAIQNQ